MKRFIPVRGGEVLSLSFGSWDVNSRMGPSSDPLDQPLFLFACSGGSKMQNKVFVATHDDKTMKIVDGERTVDMKLRW